LSENVRTALITATAVLFGGLIAGGASVGTTLVNQHSEDERLEQRIDDEARGAARLLHNRFLTIDAAIRFTISRGSYLSTVHRFPVPSPAAADLKQVYSRLSSEEFEDVTKAIASAQGFFMIVASEKEELVTAGDEETLDDLEGYVDEGADALLGVADLDFSEEP
jgi:hypothetical protein